MYTNEATSKDGIPFTSCNPEFAWNGAIALGNAQGSVFLSRVQHRLASPLPHRWLHRFARSRRNCSSDIRRLRAILLWALPLTCYFDGFSDGSQYLLALSPIYLWPIAMATIMVHILTSH
jgi:hypothetical protein